VAKLVYVGPNSANKKGMSSKAYTIRRQGRTVLARYGSVQSLGGGGGHLRWLKNGPQVKKWSRFNTAEQAVAFVKKKILEKESKGYDRLPGKVRIR
jgi:predicted DNA-binding WGR domain protein